MRPAKAGHYVSLRTRKPAAGDCEPAAYWLPSREGFARSERQRELLWAAGAGYAGSVT